MRSSLSSTSSATSEVSYTEEKVPLGDGVFCSKAAYKELINVEESHADWAYALLKGVFGEKAHLMRVRINSKNTENERFSSNFLMVAKALHRDWLVKQKIQDKNGQLCPKYSATEVEKYVNGLPAYLADRAYDMQGPRDNARKKSGDHAPKRKQSEEPKRKYIRRGQPLLEIQQHLLPECNTQSLPLQQSLSQHQLLQQQPQESSYQQQQSPHCSQQPFDYSSYFMQPSTSGTFENLESASTTFTIL